MSLESAVAMLQNRAAETQATPAAQEAATQSETPQQAGGQAVASEIEPPSVKEQTPPQPEAAGAPSQLTLLAKAEAAARQREKQLKEQIEAAERRAKEYETRASELSSKWDTLKKKPEGVLDEELGPGWYQGVTNRLLGKQATPDEEIKSLKETVGSFDQRVEERARALIREELAQRDKQEQERQNLLNYVETGKNLLKESDAEIVRDLGDNFEKEYLKTANEHFVATGELLTPSEVILKIEQQYEETLSKLANNAKVKKLFGVQHPEQQSAQKTQPAQAKTLSSALTENSSATQTHRALTDEERIAKAARALNQRWGISR